MGRIQCFDHGAHMIFSFKNDYSEGAHPVILNALMQSNYEQHEGYGQDHYCRKAVERLKAHTNNPDADVHFTSGGTQANAVIINAVLKPYESVIAADTGHINVHEAGAVEHGGHKINIVKNRDGKLCCEAIASVLDLHTDEHMVKPKLVYLSNATETGTIYRQKELETISRFCKSKNLLLYLDGARIGCALTSSENDLTLAQVSGCVDVFYIGGTKNGALIGEAIIINHEGVKENFRFHLKQHGALLSKSRLLGIQFLELFDSNLYFELAGHANKMAARLSRKIEAMGYAFFPFFPIQLLKK